MKEVETRRFSGFHPLEEVSEDAPGDQLSPEVVSFHPLEEVSEVASKLLRVLIMKSFHPLEEVSEAERDRLCYV